MDNLEALEMLNEYWFEYQQISNPKYRNIDYKLWQKRYDTLMENRQLVASDEIYIKLIAALSQILQKCKRLESGRSPEATWNNIAERGIGKAFPTLTRKPGAPISFPFESENTRNGHKCFINNGFWGARNYMVMDVLAYFYLLKEGLDRLPDSPLYLFDSLASIKKRELEYSQETESDPEELGLGPLTESEIQVISKSPHYTRFTDRHFRKFTKMNLKSNDILRLIYETSNVEFKLVFPVRLQEKKKAKEMHYMMNAFSRLFEFGYIDNNVRASDSAVKMREYWIRFNTMLGELFVHNLKTKNYDWIREDFYILPETAQLFFRKFLVNNDFERVQVNLVNIQNRLNLIDSNISNLKNTIEQGALEPLKSQGFIKSYGREEGLHGDKYVIIREFPKK